MSEIARLLVSPHEILSVLLKTVRFFVQITLVPVHENLYATKTLLDIGIFVETIPFHFSYLNGFCFAVLKLVSGNSTTLQEIYPTPRSSGGELV